MSIFGSILAKLGIGAASAAAAPTAQPITPANASQPKPASPAAPAAPAIPSAMSEVDVAARLEKRAAESTQKLNWKTSIVDLLKLLDLDSSFRARKELATELGCPAELMGDSARMNIWLHKSVLRKIAENGGYIPAELIN
ncbi:MAG: DUF3597 domain-containing protein [Steroidobacteraceae bacterium]